MKEMGTIAERHGIDPNTWVALKHSIYPGCRDDSIIKAYQYCQSRNLDVMKKPVHIVSMKVPDRDSSGRYLYDRQGNQQCSYQDVLLPGITEYRMTAAQTGLFAGQDEPIFGPTVNMYGREVPQWCKVTVYRLVNGQKCAFTHIEFFEEACGLKNAGKNTASLNVVWARRPCGQLAKCAVAGALRAAFPGEIGGMVTAEEVYSDVTEASMVSMHSDVEDNGQAPQRLSTDQLSALLDAFQKAGSLNPNTVLNAYQVERLEDIPAEKFDEVMGRIDNWITLRDGMKQAQPPTPTDEVRSPSEQSSSDKPKSGDNVPPVYVRDDAPAWGETKENTQEKEGDDNPKIVFQ